MNEVQKWILTWKKAYLVSKLVNELLLLNKKPFKRCPNLTHRESFVAWNLKTQMYIAVLNVSFTHSSMIFFSWPPRFNDCILMRFRSILLDATLGSPSAQSTCVPGQGETLLVPVTEQRRFRCFIWHSWRCPPLLFTTTTIVIRYETISPFLWRPFGI